MHIKWKSTLGLLLGRKKSTDFKSISMQGHLIKNQYIINMIIRNSKKRIQIWKNTEIGPKTIQHLLYILQERVRLEKPLIMEYTSNASCSSTQKNTASKILNDTHTSLSKKKNRLKPQIWLICTENVTTHPCRRHPRKTTSLSQSED